MYTYLCSIILAVGCFGTTQCIDDYQSYPDEKKDIPNTGFPGYGYIGNDQKKDGFFFPGGNFQNGEKKDIPQLPELRKKIERPCRVSDIVCIQHYFEEHSHCKEAYGMGPKEVRRVISNQFYPVINVTQINLDDKVTGLNTGRIQEFYINRETDKLVLGVEFQGLSRASKNTFLKYHRKAKEPIVTHGYTRVSFNSLYITITIPQIKNLRLDKADIFGISNDAEPVFEMSKSLGESSDKTVQMANAEFLVKKPIVVSELLLTESPFYAASYIQHAICDFGLQLI